MERVQTLLRLPQELRDKVVARAKARGFTMNGLIIEILWAWDKAYTREEGKDDN